jgi:hypothetical protein
LDQASALAEDVRLLDPADRSGPLGSRSSRRRSAARASGLPASRSIQADVLAVIDMPTCRSLPLPPIHAARR